MLRISDLTYIYGEGTPFKKVAVNNVNLKIEDGEFLGVIGHTGSGKSTLIQHLNALLKPSSGKIYLNGVDIWKDKLTTKNTRFKVGMVFQYPEHQLFADTVFKDIGFGPTNMGLSGDEIDRRVRETAAAVGLSEETLDKSPFELSGGQKRRVAIAGVMAMEPEILVLDEPTAGLDPRGSEQILQLVKDYHDRKNATIIFVSHSMEDIAKYATTLLVMNKGEIFAHGDTKTVFSRSRELEEIGLDVPQITRVFNRLKDKGYFTNKQVFTVPYAVELMSAFADNEQ